MFDTLFGAEMPLAVKFFLAFLVVLGLILGFAWAVRRFGTGRLGGASTRGRQPRLAVIDYASVDGRRRLILVRRDNVEHLLMIGGPTDVVVEPNIVRAVAAPRDLELARRPESRRCRAPFPCRRMAIAPGRCSRNPLPRRVQRHASSRYRTNWRGRFSSPPNRRRARSATRLRRWPTNCRRGRRRRRAIVRRRHA